MAITSLFGPTPQELIAAQVKEQEQMDMLRNQQIAQQGGQFGVFAPLYQAGLKFGDLGSRAITQSLFPEIRNPQLQQAQTIQSVLQTYQGQNLGDPTVLQKIASDLFAAGAPDAGIKALATAKSLTTKDDFVTGKPGEKIFRRGPGGQLIEVVSIPDREKDLKPSSDFAQAAVELGFGARANLDDYNLNEARAINNLIEARRIKTAGAGASKIEIKGQENVLDIDKDDAKDYKLSQKSAQKALPVLNNMQRLLDSPQGIIGGTAAEARTGFLKALDTFGVSTAEARKAVSNTEQFNIQTRNLLQSIIKQFGYNPSNADVKFALESLPNVSNSPEGLRAILNSLIKANKDQLNESTRALDYFRKNRGSFEGFTPNLDIVAPGGGPKPPSQMTDEELRAEIARRRQPK